MKDLQKNISVATLVQKYNIKKYKFTLDGQVTTDTDLKADLTFFDIIPGQKTVFKSNYLAKTANLTSSIENEYRHKGLCLELNLESAPVGNTIKVNGSLKKESGVVGVSTKYNVNTGDLSELKGAVGFSLKTGEYSVYGNSILNQAKNRDNILGATFFQNVNPSLNLAANVSLNVESLKTQATFGFDYLLQTGTRLKATLNNESVAKISISDTLINNQKIIFSGSVNPQLASSTVGFSILL